MTLLDPRDARIEELEAQLAAKDARIAQLEALLAQALSRIAELERQVGQHSKNSSRPASSDGPGVERRPKSPTGRKPGGQKGHKGHYRVLVGPERVQEFKECKPRQCRQCHGALEGEDSRPRRHQVVEVPPLTARITEYRLHRLACGQCGARTRAALPTAVPSTCFGPNLTALLAFMTGRMRLSKREAREFLVEALVERRASAALCSVYQQAEAFVRIPPWVNMDETGWRQTRRRAWLWVRATRKVSVFRVAKTRSQTEAKEQLGQAFQGVAITDRFAGYNWVDTVQRQLCWAHLARDFQALSQWEGMAGLVGQGLVAQACALFAAWGRYQGGRLNAWNLGRKLAPIKKRVRAFLEWGAALAPGRPSRQCAGLLKFWPALWRFTQLDGVEPTNNKAERDLRLAVLWRKGSFGTHSPQGSRFTERLLTVTASLRAQGRSVLAFLREAMAAALHGNPAPSLLPAEH